MKEKEDISYGVVPVYLDEGVWKVLVVHQISYRGKNDTFWILPKGHAEGDESPIEAARRELAEETGVTKVKILAEPTIDIQYSFRHEDVLVKKSVKYFVGICSSTETTLSQPEEIKEIAWLDFDAAFDRLTHQNSKDILEQTKTLLETMSV